MALRNSRITAVAIGAAVIVGASSFGAVAAKLVTSEDIKNQTIQKEDIGKDAIGGSELKDGSLKAKDFAADALVGLKGAKGDKGDKGDPGVKGDKGDKGEPGVNGDAGVSNLIVGSGYAGLGAHDTWAPGAYGETIEECPAGQFAIGGGFSQDASTGGDGKYDLGGRANVQITVSAPYFKGEYVPVDDAGNFRADQWVVRGYNHSDAPVDVRAWVVCADVAN